jgi:hypothetical protein
MYKVPKPMTLSCKYPMQCPKAQSYLDLLLLHRFRSIHSKTLWRQHNVQL